MVVEFTGLSLVFHDVINSSRKNPKQAMKFIEDFYSDPVFNSELHQSGHEDIHSNKFINLCMRACIIFKAKHIARFFINKLADFEPKPYSMKWIRAVQKYIALFELWDLFLEYQHVVKPEEILVTAVTNTDSFDVATQMLHVMFPGVQRVQHEELGVRFLKHTVYITGAMPNIKILEFVLDNFVLTQKMHAVLTSVVNILITKCTYETLEAVEHCIESGFTMTPQLFVKSLQNSKARPEEIIEICFDYQGLRKVVCAPETITELTASDVDTRTIQKFKAQHVITEQLLHRTIGCPRDLVKHVIMSYI